LKCVSRLRATLYKWSDKRIIQKL